MLLMLLGECDDDVDGGFAPDPVGGHGRLGKFASACCALVWSGRISESTLSTLGLGGQRDLFPPNLVEIVSNETEN